LIRAKITDFQDKLALASGVAGIVLVLFVIGAAGSGYYEIYKHTKLVTQATQQEQQQQQQQQCLTEALWHEARSEQYAGMKAIAEVVYNRANSTNETICEVIKKPWQFSYRNRLAKDYKLDPKQITNLLDQQAYYTALSIAREGYTRFLGSDVMWYAHIGVKPVWAKQMKTVATIGKHRFYSK
jgi:N-acetylmuramoyl-L-alanine amidase